MQEKQHLFFALQLYLTFHSYGQYILYPWGYARRDTPDRNDLHSLGLKGAQAAKSVNGRRYSVGTAAKMLYPAAGKLNFQTLCTYFHTCSHLALLTNAVQAEVIILTLVLCSCPFTAVKQRGNVPYVHTKVDLICSSCFLSNFLSKGLWDRDCCKKVVHFSSRTIHCIF